AKRNEVSRKIGEFKKAKQETPAGLANEADVIKTQLEAFNGTTEEAEAKTRELLLSIPNLLDASTPLGKTPEDNKVVSEWVPPGRPLDPGFAVKNHVEAGEALGLLDIDRAGKLAGSRFAVLKGPLATLERALIQLMLDTHTREHGYTEIYPPLLLNAETLTGTGQLPKFEEDLYRMRDEALYLSPTEEVALCSLHRDEVIDESALPVAYTAGCVSFRREAGSYGKDTRGIIRNHQFKNVELVRFCRPEDSAAELELIRTHAEAILKKLAIPYRVLALCSGDIGFAAMKTYDLEVWMPGEKMWREISSCSNCGDFQARRINVKYKKADGKKEFVHLLNGTGVSVNRMLAAVLENHQEPDGSVRVPQALRHYLPFERITK
ncbi:MAG: serine--tRNA ligase, partial [Elusimicrobiota bacterium]